METTCTGTWKEDWAAQSEARDGETWLVCNGCRERMVLKDGTSENFPPFMDVAGCRELSVLRKMDAEDAAWRMARQLEKDVAKALETQVRWDRGLWMQARHEMFREMDAAAVAAGTATEPF